MGYLVTAVVRKPASPTPSENLGVARGDVADKSSLLEAFKKSDPVISCFGPANRRKAGKLISAGAQNIVEAAEQVGVKRMVFMSGRLQTNGTDEHS